MEMDEYFETDVISQNHVLMVIGVNLVPEKMVIVCIIKLGAKQSPAVNMQRVIAKINLGLFYPDEATH